MKLTAFITVLASTAVSAQLLCITSSTDFSPSASDCLAAYKSIPPPPPSGLVPCPRIYAPRWTYAESGTCRIEGYSSGGDAACLDRKAVIESTKKLLTECNIGGKDGRVEGGAEIFKEEGAFKGVRIVRVPE
ncbi:hypothetical protein BJ508DRAFT_410158 [Ascobolus immersus RN42]|uniref:Ecp2 effector protein domain-containing protein n=1 Tax=Ascobolus immersus RN42 TaxID=1160509 RepID=A0A3N4IU78_ASCIM|nr:hypothetical protein BJ508DRAFT_410158 [Ascobolus immersus RN42]